MREIDLREHVESEPTQLSPTERGDLDLRRQKELLGQKVLDVNPVAGGNDQYCLTPGSVVGAFRIGDLDVSIRPKLEVSRVLYLASYAMGAFRLRDKDAFDFERADSLVEALAMALATAADRAFARGLLQGYRTEEEALCTVRGRMRIEEQFRRRYGAPLPVEVRYDDFTTDFLPNRLVKAAVFALGRMRIRHPPSRAALGRICARLDNVRLKEFPPNRVPEVEFDRLNEHYRQVVALSRLVLQQASFEAARGSVRAGRVQEEDGQAGKASFEAARGSVRAYGFLIDMNVVFQEFLTRALREKLGASERTLRSDRGFQATTLDEDGRVRLHPDLSWWEGGRCLFVGDAKYKRMKDERIPNADLYQLLAYVTALDLPGGLLVYAKGETEPVKHRVRHSGVRLQVAAVDLAGTIDELLARVGEIAGQVKELRREAYERAERIQAISAA